MKRLIAATAASAALALSAAPAYAAGTPVYGSVKLNWSVSTTASLAIVTQYPTSPAFTQGLSTPTLGASPAGTCTGVGTTETAFNVTFGAIVPSLSAPVACLYENAVAVSVTTNDSAGFTVKQYTDTALPASVGLCAYANGATGALATTTRTAAFPAASAPGTCAGGGTNVPAGASGVDSAGTTPGNPGTGGLEYYSGSSTGAAMISSASAALTPYYQGEDLMLELATGAPSANAQSAYVTIVLTPN